MTFKSVNPYNGDLVDTHPADQPNVIEQKLSQAFTAFEYRAAFPLNERRTFVRALAVLTEAQADKWSKLMALEMGKPVVQGRAEVKKCAALCRVYADKAEKWLAYEDLSDENRIARVYNEPIGVILGVMPWNFPFWQVYRFVIPAVLAGNTTLLKHASNVMGCAREMVQLFNQAGAPKGVFDALYVGSERVGELIEDRRIAGVSLTGSEKAGSAVAAIAGKNIKPVVLELGGSNSFIVFEDANVNFAVKKFVNARFLNSGQSCIAAKRLLLHESIKAEFLSALNGRMREFKTGDPLEEDTFIGPLARVDLAEELEAQLNSSLADGAELIIGGKREGALFSPTLVDGVKPGMSIFDEETFGPVAAVSTFSSFEEAVALSNRSRFGLGTSVFTRDLERMMSEAWRFNEGAVFINDMVYSDPILPFGGVKVSGVGRELGKDGILAFVNRKTVVAAR